MDNYNLINYLSKKNLDVIFDVKTDIVVLYVNSYSYLLLRKENISLEISDVILTDGIMLTSMINFFSDFKTTMRTFDMTSIAEDFFNYCNANNKSVYVLGSDNKSVKKFTELITNSFCNIKIAGYHNGYFNEDENEKIILNILKSSPNFIIVGLGTPKQEKFAIKFKQVIIKHDIKWKGILFTCGGFIHQTTNRINYYPKIVNKLNLRLLYRLYKENNYDRLSHYPVFVYSFFRDLIGYNNNK